MLELACAVAIVAIVAAASYPSLTQFLAGQRVKATANEVVSVLARARFEALSRNQPVKVVPADGDWSRGWWIVLAEDDRMLAALPASDPSVRVDSPAPQVVFGWSGRVAGGATEEVRLAVETRTHASEALKRCVRLDPAGRAYVAPGACS